MSQVDAAEAALRSAPERAQGLAILGRLEPDEAVAEGPSSAADLLGYYDRLSAANQWTAPHHIRVRQFRRHAGLPKSLDALGTRLTVRPRPSSASQLAPGRVIG